MSTQEWITKAREHKEELIDLIESYHPASHATHGIRKKLPITAPNPESACIVIREKIQREERGLAYPRERFLEALDAADWQEITSLLSSAWFGIPESTACWSIGGFAVAVDLIEDMPDDEVTIESPHPGGQK